MSCTGWEEMGSNFRPIYLAPPLSHFCSCHWGIVFHMAPWHSQGSSERHVSLEAVSGYASKLPYSRILWNYLHIFTIIISPLLAPVSPFDSGAMLEDCVGFSFFPSDLSFHFLFLSGSDDPKSFPSDSQEGICPPLPIETSTKVIFALI